MKYSILLSIAVSFNCLAAIQTNSIEYWQTKVSHYPELSEPKVILGWHYLVKSKRMGDHQYLAKSCEELSDSIELNVSRNGIKLGLALANYQHDFTALERLSSYYLSRWQYDGQVILWRLQGAIAVKNTALINEIEVDINNITDKQYGQIGKAALHGFNKEYTLQIAALKKAMDDIKSYDLKLKSWLWLQIAAIYIDKLDNLSLANSALIQAEQLNPTNPDIIRHRIEWLILSGELDKANHILMDLKQWHSHNELGYFEKIIAGEQEVVFHHKAPIINTCLTELTHKLVNL